MNAPLTVALPGHKQLPETDGLPMQNFLQPFQMTILTQAVWPVLEKLHPDGQFLVGMDVGIYWRLTDPPLDGCKAPDWIYVPNVPPLLDGDYRRSYVLWHEREPPLVLVEFASGDGSEERDRTPNTGKFWVYENAVRARYYAIHEVDAERVEVFELRDGQYHSMPANERGHFPIPPLGVELGLWRGTYENYTVPWLRFYDAAGRLLPLPEETAEEERRRAEEAHRQAVQERQRADDERQRAEQAHRHAEQERQAREAAEARAALLAEKLRQLGVDPERVS
jgi:Uma2 family endonuclease